MVFVSIIIANRICELYCPSNKTSSSLPPVCDTGREVIPKAALLWPIFLASGGDWYCGLGYQWDAQSQRFPFSLPNLCSTYSIHSVTGTLSCAKSLCGLAPHQKHKESVILVLSSGYSVGLRWPWESNEKLRRKQKILPLWTCHLDKRYRELKTFPWLKVPVSWSL